MILVLVIFLKIISSLLSRMNRISNKFWSVVNWSLWSCLVHFLVVARGATPVLLWYKPINKQVLLVASNWMVPSIAYLNMSSMLFCVPNVQPFTLVKQADALVIEYENTCAMFATIQHQVTFQYTLTQMAMISLIFYSCHLICFWCYLFSNSGGWNKYYYYQKEIGWSETYQTPGNFTPAWIN